MTVRLTKIYTKAGDAGFTQLVGGTKVSKGDWRLECYGTVDELNSHIGVVRTLAEEAAQEIAASARVLAAIQNTLFDLGSVMARETQAEGDPKAVAESQIQLLETTMDTYLESLKPLNSFTLPGGSHINAHAHVVRTVCRRLERLLWRRSEELQIDPMSIKYINRLSDFFFVYSRWCAHIEGKAEFLWEPGKK